MDKFLIVLAALFSSFTYAKQSPSIFVKHEFNATDSITGVGGTISLGPAQSLIKGELISSLNYAEVLDDKGSMQNFLSLDTGVRLGFYGKVFFYIEAGVDAFELFLDDDRDDDYFYDEQNNNKIDGYAGLGAGINVEHFRLEAFVKARQIDADTWESDKQVFYGLQLSASF